MKPRRILFGLLFIFIFFLPIYQAKLVLAEAVITGGISRQVFTEFFLSTLIYWTIAGGLGFYLTVISLSIKFAKPEMSTTSKLEKSMMSKRSY